MVKPINIAAFAALLAWWGCSKENRWDCITPMGDIITRQHTTPPLKGIKLKDKIDLVIVPAGEPHVEVTFGEGVISDIKTGITDSVMVIENQATCNWVRRLNVTPEVVVYTQTLEYLRYSGTGNINFVDTLEVPYLHYEQFGGSGSASLKLNTDSVLCNLTIGYGDAKLTGHTGKLSLYSDDVSSIDASSMKCQQAYVAQWSVRDDYVNVSGYLFAHITGSGNLHCKGDPNLIDLDRDGSGRLIEE